MAQYCNSCNNGCRKKGRFLGCIKGYCRCEFAVAFGLGLVISCFCPTGFTLFITAVIIVALGIAVARR